MKRLLLFSLLILTLAASPVSAQVTYETFEGGAALAWTAADGTYGGAVANPDPAGLNTSGFAGSYTKSNAHAYSLFLATLAAPIDLSVNNQFKIQIYAPVATSFILKLEGSGEAIEVTKNIANANVWQEYTFDFSAAAGFTTINKFILFFDPGVTTSGDTYLFDNIVAMPAGACAGTTPDPLILDNFECQRNATYGVGWDILVPLTNPDPTGVNTSSMVGQYTDPQDQWSALVIDYDNPIDLSVNNQIKAKVWSPKTGQILFKLEGGVSAPAEVFVNVTQTNTWVEYSADFSGQANANHKKIAIFFNAGVQAQPGDIYYIDDITVGVQPPPPALEDFENGASLGWGPLNNSTLNHGTFTGPFANPDPSGNPSAFVGKYTKGASLFSTLTALLPAGIDLSSKPQLNLQVWAPAAGEEVTLQLSSAINGVKEVTREIPATGQWVDLKFSFSDFATITDFERINILFNGGTANQGSIWYFDNLTQSSSTVDPCEGVSPILNIVDDFECQRNYDYGAGLDRLTVKPNPNVSAANSSLSVGEYKDPLDPWSALVVQSGGAWNLAVNNQLRIKIWSPIAAPLLFKLEGGTSPAFEAPMVQVTATSQWVEYVADFSSQAAANHARLAIFFNAGQTPAQEDLYYIDDIKWTRASYSGCIDDHETPSSTISNFKYFANGAIEAAGTPFEVVNNPNKSGINTSDKVGLFVKAADALPFAGMYADLDVPIDFQGNKTVKAKVLMDHIGNFAVKLEGSATGAPPIEIPVANTVTNQWEELTFDFSAASNTAQYKRLTIFFDLTIDATGSNVSSYFDDIVIGEGQCLIANSLWDKLEVPVLQVFPNPAANQITVDNLTREARLDLWNMQGQLISRTDVWGQTQAEISLEGLQPGIYLISAYDRDGVLAGSVKFVKQ
ncbi:MAG: T9SS type A sorting domain-containing protein [Bacteroidia bacterium]|nr:T9SS type A sorting domain-containing protein [Bacteroidia bacterium]